MALITNVYLLMANKLKLMTSFGVIPNIVLRDKTLTMKDKGLWGYLQSKPDGWEFSAERIAEECSDGRDSIRNGLISLEDAGYLTRKKFQNELGHWGIEYILREKPVKVIPRTPLPVPDSPTSEKASSKESSLSKKEILVTPSGITTENKEKEPEIPKGFVASSWVESLMDSPQPHIALIGYYFFKYSEHNFPNKVVATEEMKKNLAPATWLVKNFTEDEIKKTMVYCKKNFADVHWNLSTVKKQITYVTSK